MKNKCDPTDAKIKKKRSADCIKKRKQEKRQKKGKEKKEVCARLVQEKKKSKEQALASTKKKLNRLKTRSQPNLSSVSKTLRVTQNLKLLE